MVTYYTLYSFLALLSVILSILPTVTTLPFGIDAALVQSIGYFNALRTLVPWLDVMWQALLFFLGFKVTMMMLRIFKIF